MVAKANSRATKAAAVVLARLSSPEVAAATFRVKVDTVRLWQAGGEVSDDTWTSVRDLLLSRGAEMAARGETTGLVQTLTAAGISDRNVRYSTLIARREARREPEPPKPDEPDPVQQAGGALRNDQRRWLMAWIDDLDQEQQRNPDREEPPTRSDVDAQQASMLAFLAEVAGLTEDEVAERQRDLDARRDARCDKLEAERAAVAYQNAPEPVATGPTPYHRP